MPVQIHLLVPGEVVGVPVRIRLRHAHHLAVAELHQIDAHIAHVGNDGLDFRDAVLFEELLDDAHTSPLRPCARGFLGTLACRLTESRE